MKLRRWQFLLISMLIMLIILAIGTGRYFALVRQERLEELRRLEEENERLIQKARVVQEQLRIMDERLTELEEMLLNLQRTEQIVSGTLPSRGGHQYTATTMPLLSPSGFSPARFERAFAGTGLEGIGEALALAEAETGINALVLAQNEYQNLPPVGLIRRAALDLTGPPLTAAEAWGIVLRAVHAFGFYQERKALESMPENVAQVVKWMGWQEICHSDNLDVVRGQFIRMYDTQTSRKRDLELMPPEVRQMISAAVLQLPEKTGKEVQ